MRALAAVDGGSVTPFTCRFFSRKTGVEGSITMAKGQEKPKKTNKPKLSTKEKQAKKKEKSGKK
jgi:hypothetical protein